MPPANEVVLNKQAGTEHLACEVGVGRLHMTIRMVLTCFLKTEHLTNAQEPSAPVISPHPSRPSHHVISVCSSVPQFPFSREKDCIGLAHKSTCCQSRIHIAQPAQLSVSYIVNPGYPQENWLQDVPSDTHTFSSKV